MIVSEQFPGTNPSRSPSREEAAMDRPIAMTFFRDHRAQEKKEGMMTLRRLVETLEKVRAPAKSQLPWIKLATFGEVQTPKGSFRHDGNVISISGIEADYDGEQLTVDRARQVVGQANLAAVIYTSPSHTAAAPRWRILCPVSTDLPPGERSRLVARLNGLFLGALAGESFTLSQSYYYGAVQGSTDHTVVCVEGRHIDLADDLDAEAVGRTVKAPPPVGPAPQPSQYSAESTDGTRYGLKGLANECWAIRRAGDGEKHTTINRSAYSIGGLVAIGHLAEGVAFRELAAAVGDLRSRCDDFAAAERTLRDGFEAGKAEPRSVPERTYQAPQPTWQMEPPAWLDEAPPPADTDYGEVDPAEPGASAPRVDPYLGPGPLPLALVWFDDIKTNIDARDFVQGVLVEQSAAVVYGESNAGKTFWATDLALHVAAGIEWHGKRVEGGPVIYCVLEGGIGFQNRVAAWRNEHKHDFDGPVPFAAIQSGLNLLDPEADTPRLIATLLAVAATHGAPKLVVVDTLSRALAGGNENSPEDMGSLVANMDAIRQAVGCCVLFIHHSGKDAAKGARGHSLLRAAVDTEIEVKAEEDSPLKTATVVKQRDLTKGQVFNFQLRVIEVGENRHGEAVTTCIIEPEPADTSGRLAPRKAPKGHAKRALDVLIDALLASGRPGDPGVPDGLQSVPEKWWRDRFCERAMPGASPETKERTFRRVSDLLIQTSFVGIDRGRVWVLIETTGHSGQADISADE